MAVEPKRPPPVFPPKRPPVALAPVVAALPVPPKRLVPAFPKIEPVVAGVALAFVFAAVFPKRDVPPVGFVVFVFVAPNKEVPVAGWFVFVALLFAAAPKAPPKRPPVAGAAVLVLVFPKIELVCGCAGVAFVDPNAEVAG